MADRTEASLKAELEALLSEPMDSVLRRERETFDEQTVPFSDRLVLFGAGRLGRKTLAGLRQVGIEPLAFTDNNQALWGTDVEGIPVLAPPEAAQRFGDSAAFVVTIWRGPGTDRMGERMQFLRRLGCATVTSFLPLFWKHQVMLLPHYALDAPHCFMAAADELRRAFRLWGDDASRALYISLLRTRILAEFDAILSPVPDAQYFPDGLFAVSPEEVFADCGAYDGDTIRDLFARGGATRGGVVAFEPDPSNLDRLRLYLSSLSADLAARVAIQPVAVGARREKVRFAATGTGLSHVGPSGIEVNCAPLDEVLKGYAPTYVKMDIEGAEMDALEGARRLIAANLPLLGICVYHECDHLWRVPLFADGLSDRYRFFLRSHGFDGHEVVCYAIPEGRLSPK